MAEPKVSIIMTLVDKATPAANGVRGAFGKLGQTLKGFGNEAKQLLSNKLVQGVGLVGLYQGLQKAWTEADELTRSFQRVQGTAKIVDVPLQRVVETAREAKDVFGLSTASANNFASSAVTMAAKAGDVSKSSELMAATLNLAAARGISAEEALEALNITLKGQDEGLDKLVQKNPSAYYKSWAEAAGRSAGSLSELEKKLAIVDGLIEEGSRVRGSYVEWLETVDGKAFLAGEKVRDAQAKFGVATSQLRVMMLGTKTWVADALGWLVEFFQHLGIEMSLIGPTIKNKFLNALGAVSIAIGEFFEGNRILMTVLGDWVDDVGTTMANAGARMKARSTRELRDIEDIRIEAYQEMMNDAEFAEQSLASIAEDGAEARIETAGKETAAMKDAYKAREQLAQMHAKATGEILTAHGTAMKQAEAVLARALIGADAATKAKLLDQFKEWKTATLMEWAGMKDGIEASVTTTSGLVLKGFAPIPEVLEDTSDAAKDAKVDIEALGRKIGDGASAFMGMAEAAGVLDDDLKNVLGSVGQLGDGLAMLASGNALGGIAAGIGGVVGILGGIFGGSSPEEQARKKLIQENNERLRDLERTVGDLYRATLPGAQIATLKQINFADLFASSVDVRSGGHNVGIGQVGKFLLGKGSSLTEFKQLAADLGIDLGGDDKNFSSVAVKQVFDALGASEFDQFGNDFAGRRDFDELFRDVSGTGSDSQNASDLITRLLQFTGLSGFSAGDVNTAEGRAKIRDILTGTTQQLGSGGLGTEVFGQLTGTQFANAIRDLIGLLDGIGAAPSTVGAPSLGSSFTAPTVSAGSIVGTADAMPVLSLIADNTLRTADATEALNVAFAMIAKAQGGGTATDNLNAILQAEADLTNVSQGVG